MERVAAAIVYWAVAFAGTTIPPNGPGPFSTRLAYVGAMGFEERPGHLEDRSGHQTTVVQSEKTPSEAVIWAVAETAGVDPLELDSLHESIDPDALDTLIQRDAATSVTFEYHGRTVTVRGDGEVVVQGPASPEP